MVTVSGNGYFGLAERGPLDRVIAAVGCVDVAPAWPDQLAPGGFCLVPLLHGGWHPLTRIAPSGGAITGVVVGRAGFVGIQGHQAGRSPWPHSGRLGPQPELWWAALPGASAADLKPEAIGGRRMWDLGYRLALEDRRTACLLSLPEGGSSAAVDPGTRPIGWAGGKRPALRDRNLAIARQWVAMGRPAVGDFTSRFTPLTDAPSGPASVRSDTGLSMIDRVDFRQTATRAAPV